MEGRFGDFADGRRLFGDSSSPEEIEQWYEDEKEGYFNLAHEQGAQRSIGSYGYRALNWQHGFAHLPRDVFFDRALAIGGAFGEEIEPIKNRCRCITILEPSEGFEHEAYEYVKPHPSGRMDFQDSTFDLVTCFGVLHHIPNVSFVVQEISRCMKPRGWLLLREPIVSMGNWDFPRRGLTRRERGIPAPILFDIVKNAGLEPVEAKRCVFSLTNRIPGWMRGDQQVYNVSWITRLDAVVCSLPFWFQGYHPKSSWQRLRAMSTFIVARKP